MKIEGICKLARNLLALSAALLLSRPVSAQRALVVLPHAVDGDDLPITFMRPHYRVHMPGASAQTGAPSTAFTPSQIRHAYGFDQVSNQGAGEIIGIVDAYDDPNAESDLGTFDSYFGLPACTSANGCFRKVYSGSKPATNSNWAVEIALDVEWTHAIAPKATILLVETPSNSFANLLSGVQTAVHDGASVVSMSWTVGEFSGETSYDNKFVQSGVTFLAASGDNGTGVAYPAASPDVVGVGGTSLHLASNGSYASETAWSGSGGGQSQFEREPSYQAQFPIPDDSRGYRGVPDVSYDGDPSTGVAIFDSVAIGSYSGWYQVGGTSAATPQWAALVAIVNSMRAAARKSNLASSDSNIYSLGKSSMASDFHAVTSGTNGTCGTLCDATAGYDYVSGLGTPVAPAVISALVAK